MSSPIELVIKRTASNNAVRRRISRQIEDSAEIKPLLKNVYIFSIDKSRFQPMVAPVAGFSAALAEITLLFPTEYCKTQLQINRQNVKFSLSKHLCERNWRIYQALPPMLVGAPIQGMIRFSCLDFVQQNGVFDNIGSPVLKGVFAGITAGIVESLLIVTPMETVKTKLIHSKKSMWNGIRNIINTEGMYGLYNGLLPTICKSASNQAIRFVVFMKYKSLVLNSVSDLGHKKDLTPSESLLGGVFAGLVGCVLNTPIDTVKSRMQSFEKNRYKNSIDCASQMVKQEGALSLYKGLVMRAARVVPGQGIIFLVYDQVSCYLTDKLK